MQVLTTVTRGDVIRLNLAMAFRLQTCLRLFLFFLFVSALLLWLVVLERGTDVNLLAFVAAATAMSLAWCLVWLLICIGCILVNTTAKSGMLGEHRITIEERGLREVTVANDSLHFWPAIRRIEKSGRAMYIEISPWQYFILPQRDFASSDEYDRFYELAQHNMESARATAGAQ
jgi:YcxB-like protein